jgi:hypothetical protein
MSITLVRKAQIRPLNISRSDINTTTTGSALITKIIVGTGLTLSSTGVDAGTGDATIGLSIASASTIGGVKIGSGLTVAVDGTISVNSISVTWGSITGSLSSQTDLQTALNAKYNNPTGTTSQYIDGTGALQTFPSALATGYVRHEVKAQVAINKGQAVYVVTADGTNMIVGLASNDAETTSSKTMGLLAATVAINGKADVVTEGLLAGLNTSTATIGDPVWLGTNGNLLYGLANKPYAPAHLVFLGIVTRVNNSNGEIFVKVQNGFELDELHDVRISGATTGQLLRKDSDGLWKNWTANYITAAALVGYATEAYVNSAITTLVNSAPATLDTLNELAAALGNDANFSTTISTALGNRLRVDIGTQGLTSTQQGYGRTNLGLGSLAVLSSIGNSYITDLAWTKLTGVPTTIAGYGITDSLIYATSTYSNPSWISSLAWSKITGAPAFITSYTETDTLATVTARGAATSTGVAFNGGATASNLRLNGAPISSEASLSLGAHNTDEGGQLVLNKATSYNFAGHIDVWRDILRFLYGTDTATAGVAMSINLSTKQFVLPAYTASNSFTGTAVGHLAFDASGNIITVAVPSGAVSSVNAGTGVSVNATTGAVTVSIGQSVATSATPSFDKVFLTNNGNGTNLKVGDDVWIGDVNQSNTLGVVGQQDSTSGYISFGSDWTTKLGRTGTGDLTWGGNRIWTAANLTNLNQLTNGPGYITGITSANVVAALGYTPYNATNPNGYITSSSLSSYLPLAGGTMTGNINWGQTDRGLTWGMNTDGAYIKFYNTGDGDTDSRLEYATSDNGDEYHRWVIGGVERMNLKTEGLSVNGIIYSTSYGDSTQWNTAYSWGNHAGLYASITHTHTFASLTSKPTTLAGYGITDAATSAQGTKADTAYSWGNHASAGYLTSVTNISGYSGTLQREDNRTISPSELAAGQLKFGFTSWTNDNNSPYADFIHMRSYTDASGGSDNLVMFKKSGIGMRIWQQTWGSATAYSSYVDVWTTGNFTQTNVNNWTTAYGWGNHASQGYITSAALVNYWDVTSPNPVHVVSTDIVFEAVNVTFLNDITVQGHINETSSLRYKENIVNLGSVSDKVAQLRPVQYNKIGSTTSEIGLIAEEVAEIFPEFVNYNAKGQVESLNYTRLSVLLLQTVKELSDKINKLETK